MGRASGVLRLLVVGSIVAAGLGLAASPAAAAAPALTVTPATGLLDQQVVTVTGTGFTPGERLIVAQCAGAGLDGCALYPLINTTGAMVDVASDGTLHATIRPSRVIGGVSCVEVECAVVAIAHVAPLTERARTSLDFAAMGTAPAPPDAPLAIAASDMRANGAATASWGGSGYLPWFTAAPHAPDPAWPFPITIGYPDGGPGAYLDMCAPAPSGWAGCERLVVEGTIGPLQVIVPTHEIIPVAPDGTVSDQRALPRLWRTWDRERIDCAVEDCGFALEQDGAPHSNVVDVAWAPEWSPWPSARAFVVEAYATLVGRAPTPSERSAAVVALTDRSLTGYAFLRQLAARSDGLRLAELSRLYQAALDRAPDAGGLLYWASELRRTGSIAAVAGAFGRTSEFRQAFGPSVGRTTTVVNAYRRTLDRWPTGAEVRYWVDRLRAGMSRTHLVHLFSRTPEFVARRAGWSELIAVTVALLGRSPTADEWDPIVTYGADQIDVVILDVLSSDELIAAVG